MGIAYEIKSNMINLLYYINLEHNYLGMPIYGSNFTIYWAI